jgi:hypothetical protein
MLQGHHVARLAADLRDFLVAHDLQVRIPPATQLQCRTERQTDDKEGESALSCERHNTHS